MICKEVNTVMRLQRTAKFGIILMACSAIVAFLWWYSMGYLFLMWYWSYQISYFTFSLLMASPLIALNVAGLALYFGDRKTFWKINRKPRVLSTVVGSILVFLGWLVELVSLLHGLIRIYKTWSSMGQTVRLYSCWKFSVLRFVCIVVTIRSHTSGWRIVYEDANLTFLPRRLWTETLQVIDSLALLWRLVG